MGWREVGEIIRERGRQFVSTYAKKELSWTDSGATLDIPVAWFAEGFLTDEACFTRQRLTPDEIKAKYGNDEPNNGRPRDETARTAATLACFFYEAWRGENEKRGLKDFGHRSAMKDYAAQAVVEDFFAWLYLSPPHRYSWRATAKDVESFAEIVRGLMEKSKQRRDPGDWDWVDVQATRAGLWLPPKPISKS